MAVTLNSAAMVRSLNPYLPTTVYGTNYVNQTGGLSLQSINPSGTALISLRLQAGTETALSTAFSVSKQDGQAMRFSTYGVMELNSSVLGASTTTVGVLPGTGNPEGNVTARPGTVYLNRSGGRPYYKDSGTGNTGWLQL